MRAGDVASAAARFHAAIERLESIDVYAAAWLVGDCAAEIVAQDAGLWPTIGRIGSHPTVQQFVLRTARFTALRDMAERLDTAYLRSAKSALAPA